MYVHISSSPMSLIPIDLSYTLQRNFPHKRFTCVCCSERGSDNRKEKSHGRREDRLHVQRGRLLSCSYEVLFTHKRAWFNLLAVFLRWQRREWMKKMAKEKRSRRLENDYYEVVNHVQLFVHCTMRRKIFIMISVLDLILTWLLVTREIQRSDTKEKRRKKRERYATTLVASALCRMDTERW